MKNIFSKSNIPYIVGVAVATIALVASGVFALAPYVAILAPVAALGVGLPFVIGGAIFSAVAIALSAVAISKNNTISEKDAVVQAQEQRISEQKTRLAEKNTKLFDKQEQLSKKGLDYLDLAFSSKQGKQANSVDYLDLNGNAKQLDLPSVDAAKRYLMSLSEGQDVFYDAESGDPSPESQLDKEETKVSSYLGKAVRAVNCLVHQVSKATPYLAAAYLPYAYYDYIMTPVSAVDNVNVTNLFGANQGITSAMF